MKKKIRVKSSEKQVKSVKKKINKEMQKGLGKNGKKGGGW